MLEHLSKTYNNFKYLLFALLSQFSNVAKRGEICGKQGRQLFSISFFSSILISKEYDGFVKGKENTWQAFSPSHPDLWNCSRVYILDMVQVKDSPDIPTKKLKKILNNYLTYGGNKWNMYLGYNLYTICQHLINYLFLVQLEHLYQLNSVRKCGAIISQSFFFYQVT